MEHRFFVQMVTFLNGWCESAPEGCIPDRFDKVEVFREALRSILAVTGVHRLTEVLAEGWQIFTAIKIGSVSDLVPIVGAAPAEIPNELQAVNDVRDANRLEHELILFDEWLAELQELAIFGDQNRLIIDWLRDLQFVIAATLVSFG